jgi:hypothetical protein
MPTDTHLLGDLTPNEFIETNENSPDPLLLTGT